MQYDPFILSLMKLIQFILLLLLPFITYSQTNKDFEPIYQEGEQALFFSYDSCITSVQQLKELSDLNNIQKIRIDLLEIEAKCQKQSVASSKIKIDDCLERLSKTDLKDEPLRAKLLILKGSINSSNSNIYEGIPQLMEALELLENSDCHDLKDYCRIKIAEAYRVKKQYKIGFDLLHTTINQSDLSPRNRAYAYSRLAAYFNESTARKIHSRPNIDDSISKYSGLSREISEKYNFRDFIASSYNETGLNVINMNGDCDTAISYLNKSVDLFRALAYDIDYVNASNNLTWAYLKKGEFQKAIATGKHLLTIRNEKEYPQIYRRTYQLLSDSHDSIGEYRLGKKYLEQVYTIEKNLFKTYLNREVTSLSAKYNYKLKEAQLDEERQKSHFRLTLFIGIFLITVILLMVAIVMNRLRKMTFIQKQQQMKNENSILQNNIICHNKELTSNALRFVQNDNLLNEISQQVGAMEYLKKNDLKEAIQKLISDIRVNKKNEIWADFEKSFKEVHADFYKNLTQEHSDLSSKELRMSAFLKLNLTSKEIAAINGTSLRTVETNRHRLRKKLNVAEGTDLNSFFQQF